MADMRWKQRYGNYAGAFSSLREAVELSRERILSNLEKQGLIQSFEFTHELAWNLLQDYLEYQGYNRIIGSRDATRLAFKNGLIADGESWMAMIQARNQTTHTYNQNIAENVVRDILERFFPLFRDLNTTFSGLVCREDEDS